MNWLFFTRSNGDIDSMENRVDLDTDEKRRVFIGDDVATNFEIIEDGNLPINAKWDGEKYISNIDPTIALKEKRDIDLMSVTVEINGHIIKANPTEEQNLRGAINALEYSGDASCKWRQDGVTYAFTLAEFNFILSEATKKCAVIYNTWIEAEDAL